MTYEQIKNGACLLCASLILASCSSYEKRQIANGDFDYIEESQTQEVKIPENLANPAFTEEFAIPEAGDYRNEPVGESLSVTSPSLVLAIVGGTHVEEGEDSATVWFDQVSDNEALDTTIWNTIINFLEENGIGVNSFDKASQVLISDWIINDTSISKGILGWVGLNKEKHSEGVRFKFTLVLRPHGRSGALTVELIDFLETVDDQVVENNVLFDEKGAAVDILNRVLLHYDFQNRRQQARKIREVRDGVEVEQGFDEQGNPAYLVPAQFDIAWARLLLAAQAMGFTVSDIDQSTGYVYVNYQAEGGSWWSSLWGSDGKTLPVEEGDYQFKLLEQNGVTTISVLDGLGNPVDASIVNALFPEFSNVMSSGSLGL
jgi:outer membrane protein assembly factor BamC